MKTTVEISDALFDAAKRIAHERGTTLRSLVEAGLQHELSRRPPASQEPPRDARVPGHGVNPEFAEGEWDRIRNAIYAGHGA